MLAGGVKGLLGGQKEQRTGEQERCRNLHGRFFGVSEGPGPFPGLLDLWGGGGKLVEYRSALLASHGFASLALDYLTPKITMETGKMVDNTYFEVNPTNIKSMFSQRRF